MPDVDIVHENVPRKFRRAYEQLCEGLLSPEDMSEAIAKALRKTLNVEGRLPSELIFQSLRRAFSEVGVGMPIDVAATGRLVDELASTSFSQSRYLSIAVDALKAGLEQAANLHDYYIVKTAVVREFANRLLDAEFNESMPPVHHHMNASSEDIEKRLFEAEPNIESQLAHIVDQMVRHDTAEKLRKKPAKRKSSQDFSTMDISLQRRDSKDGNNNER